MGRTAFLLETEEEQFSFVDGVWLTGRFDGHVEDGFGVRASVEGLTLEQALAWARERADEVVIRYGDEPAVRFAAGAANRLELPRWPPPDLPRRLVRRRHPDDRWRDRSEGDPPIEWHVDATVNPAGITERPPHELRERRDGWLAELSRAGADSWDAGPLDELLGDLPDDDAEAGWFTYGYRALHAELAVEAATAAGAAEIAERRLRLPEGWSATFARPAPAERHRGMSERSGAA